MRSPRHVVRQPFHHRHAICYTAPPACHAIEMPKGVYCVHQQQRKTEMSSVSSEMQGYGYRLSQLKANCKETVRGKAPMRAAVHCNVLHSARDDGIICFTLYIGCYDGAQGISSGAVHGGIDEAENSDLQRHAGSEVDVVKTCSTHGQGRAH